MGFNCKNLSCYALGKRSTSYIMGSRTMARASGIQDVDLWAWLGFLVAEKTRRKICRAKDFGDKLRTSEQLERPAVYFLEVRM